MIERSIGGCFGGGAAAFGSMAVELENAEAPAAAAARVVAAAAVPCCHLGIHGCTCADVI